MAGYGFGPAREYFLVIGDMHYDSKAIVGVAHGYQFPSEGPLRPEDFSGGEAIDQVEGGTSAIVEPKGGQGLLAECSCYCNGLALGR